MSAPSSFSRDGVNVRLFPNLAVVPRPPGLSPSRSFFCEADSERKRDFAKAEQTYKVMGEVY